MLRYFTALLVLIVLVAYVSAQTALGCTPSDKLYSGSSSGIEYAAGFSANGDVVIGVTQNDCEKLLTGGWQLTDSLIDNATVTATINSCSGNAQGGCGCNTGELGTYTGFLDCTVNPDTLAVSFSGIVFATL